MALAAGRQPTRVASGGAGLTSTGVSLLAPADLSPSNLLARARAEVVGALDGDADHERHRSMMLRFIDEHHDALLRSCAPGHLTSSALVVASDDRRVLLLEHRKLRRWFQPGGHADGEANLARSAWREATEESGIESLVVFGPAIDLDVHEVRPPNEAPHLHLDVRYLVLAPTGAVAQHNHESTAQSWVEGDQLAVYDPDDGLRRLVARGLALVDAGLV